MYQFLREQVEEIKDKEFEEEIPTDINQSEELIDTIVLEGEPEEFSGSMEAEIASDTEEKLDEEIENAK